MSDDTIETRSAAYSVPDLDAIYRDWVNRRAALRAREHLRDACLADDLLATAVEYMRGDLRTLADYALAAHHGEATGAPEYGPPGHVVDLAKRVKAEG